MSLVDDYKRARSNYLKSLNSAVKNYGVDKEKYKLKIPNKITQASIRNIESHKRQLKKEIRDIKIKTGYYIKLRFKPDYDYNKEKRLVKNRFRSPQYSKASGYRNRENSTPTLEDIIIDRFFDEMEAAQQKDGGISNKWVKAVRDAGFEAEMDFKDNIADWVAKQLKEETVRKAVSKNLYNNFYVNYEYLERWLYDFESDGNGNMVHLEGRHPLDTLLETAFNIKITDEMIEERDNFYNDLGNDEDILSEILEEF